MKRRLPSLLLAIAFVTFVAIPAFAQSKAISVAQAMSLLQAMRNLDGRVVIIKQNGVEGAVQQPWDFGSGAFRMRIANNTTALAAVERSLEETRQAIVRELLKGAPPEADGKPATSIAPGTPQWEELQRQYGEALNAPASVTLSRIRASELRLDRNEIPVTALSAMAPILDDDVSPK